MKTIMKWGALVSASLASVGAGAMMGADGAHGTAPETVPGEFIVRTRHLGAYAIQSLGERLQARGFQLKETINRANDTYLVKVDPHSAAIQTLEQMSDIERVEPNYIYHIALGSKKPKPEPTPTPVPPSDGSVVPNDSDFGQLWGLRNLGQKDSKGSVGTAGADIKATQAWKVSTGSRSVVVAIIDTGVDYTHPDLKDNIWSMPGNPSVHGYNAINGKLDPKDDHYHGTHCAGTIGGVGNNGAGVAGVNWAVSIMGVKFLDSQGSGTTADAIKAIDWAREHGAQVMSNSWGGGGISEALGEAIKRARDAGIVFVAAAGNDASNNDASPNYPSNYAYDNVIAVAASNNRDAMSSFSNWGASTVDLMAPGENIYSTATGNTYKVLSGTSMATPHVSGAVALLLAREPGLTPAQVKARLRSSSDPVNAAKGKTASGGRLNVSRLISN